METPFISHIFNTITWETSTIISSSLEEREQQLTARLANLGWERKDCNITFSNESIENRLEAIQNNAKVFNMENYSHIPVVPYTTWAKMYFAKIEKFEKKALEKREREIHNAKIVRSMRATERPKGAS